MILILHAPDADEEAEELRFELGQIGFRAVTFIKITRHSTRADVLSVYPELILSVSAVIVLASPILFIDPLFIEIALNSSVEKKMLPVIFGQEDVGFPEWFDHPIRLISGTKDDPGQWNNLINSLQKRTENYLLSSPSGLSFYPN